VSHMRRICTKHLAPIYEDSHGRMCCQAGCIDARKFHVACGKKIVATVRECWHRGRARRKPCPICGLLPPTVQPRNHFERELQDCESSAVVWA
jgi:hypothetical protein